MNRIKYMLTVSVMLFFGTNSLASWAQHQDKLNFKLPPLDRLSLLGAVLDAEIRILVSKKAFGPFLTGINAHGFKDHKIHQLSSRLNHLQAQCYSLEEMLESLERFEIDGSLPEIMVLESSLSVNTLLVDLEIFLNDAKILFKEILVELRELKRAKKASDAD